MNAYRVQVTYPGCGYSEEEMENITGAQQSKHRASWLFSNTENLTTVTLRVLADDLFDAADAARRALKPAAKFLKSDPHDISIVSEIEAHRRMLADPTLPADLRQMAEAEV